MSIATVLKGIQLDRGMNLPVKFHQIRLTPLASRAVYYIQTYKQTNIHTYIQTDGKSENKGTLVTTQQAGRRHGWSRHNCILVIQFLMDRAENF